MDNNQLYYKAPSGEVFNKVRNACLEIWDTYDNAYGYVTKKTDRIVRLENVKDNMMYMISMFDVNNVQKLAKKLDNETKKEISDRLLSVGNNQYALYFGDYVDIGHPRDAEFEREEADKANDYSTPYDNPFG